jgi:DNA-binding PadR family transcriptional regulator
MHEEHRHMRDEGWGPRPGRPEWGPGRGPGRGRGGERGERGGRGERGERGGPGWGGRGGWGWGGPGPFPFMDPAMGMRGFGRHGSGGGHRSRARRGDVRAAILDLLAEGQPWNGYQIIQTIAERTQEVWRPSAGSVYPALQQLEDEGLISPEGEGRRRMYILTDEGRAYAEAHAEELRSSWDAAAGMTDEIALELGDILRQVMLAVMEVRRAGSPSQIAEARRVLTETRRSMYRILADDADEANNTNTSTNAEQAQDDQDAEAAGDSE